jgi:hypothetical protein
MLPCRKDTTGVVEFTLSYVALFLVTGILLTVVFSFVFFNDWQRTAELQSLASNFSNLLDDINNLFFETTYTFQFPEKNYAYHVEISTEYILLSAKGKWNTDLLIRHRFITRPWPRLPTQNWTTGEELHVYLNETCGHHGTKNDPIPPEHCMRLRTEQNTTINFFALQPLELLIRRPVVLEKVSIYYDLDKKHDFLLLYQVIPAG